MAVQFNVRIFRPDLTFTTLTVPFTITAGEITSLVARIHHMGSKSSHSLYLREKGVGAFDVLGPLY